MYNLIIPLHIFQEIFISIFDDEFFCRMIMCHFHFSGFTL